MGFFNVTTEEYNEAEISKLVVICLPYELFKTNVKKDIGLYKDKKFAVLKNRSA